MPVTRLAQPLSTEDAKFFALGSETAGIIVAQFGDDGAPRRYWDGSGARWFDERDMETPHLFRRRKAAETRVSECLAQWTDGTWELAFWRHADEDSQPLDRYRRMDGGEYPGTPTQ